MTFRLSSTSLTRLAGVNKELIKCVERAIALTKVDFGVTEGLRTEARQKELKRMGKSQTLKSKHIIGNAVDLVAYIGSDVSWELNLYDNVADAMKEAATELGLPLRWGAAWHISDFTKFEGTMEEAMMEYIDLRRSQDRRPFIDGPHFEIGE